jgi:gamma-glutamylputrescine oxidase
MLQKTPTAPQAPTFYHASAPEPTAYVELAGSVTADVCVVGGGIAGCSTALHLAERGYRVVLLEGEQIAWGASGRSGGQVIPGFASEQSKLDQLVGREDARRMWEMSVEAITLLRERIASHSIPCDWQNGQLQVGIKPRHRDALLSWHEELGNRYRYRTARMLDSNELHALVATRRYCVGLLDSNGGHLNPLKYTRGLAAAASTAGTRIFERSPAVQLTTGPTTTVRTPHGEVRAKHVVLCGNAYMGNLVPILRTRIMPIGTYIVATEPLGEARATALIRDNCSVTDTNFILDYFRRSADHRLLFGGRVSYSGHDAFNTAHATRHRMLQVFPQLDDVKIDYAWGGMLDITLNRAPDFGRIADNVYYLQGFSGHGIALTGMAGKLVAEAIAGQAERFDVFARIKHRSFPGGKVLRTPALVLAMLWYRLRDFL